MRGEGLNGKGEGAPFDVSARVVAATCMSGGLLALSLLDLPLATWVENVLAPGRELLVVLKGISQLPFGVLFLASLGCAVAVAQALGARGERRAATAGQACFAVLVLASALMPALGLKHVIGRARPVLRETVGHLHFEPFAFQDALASLPSAQAALAAGVVVMTTFLAPRYAPLAWTVGFLVCLSRVLLGAHWLSDVIFGWGIGYVVAAGAARALTAVYGASDSTRRFRPY